MSGSRRIEARRSNRAVSGLRVLRLLALPLVAVALAVGAAVVRPGAATPLKPVEVPVAQTTHACPTLGDWFVATGQVDAAEATTVTPLPLAPNDPAAAAPTEAPAAAPRNPATWEATQPGGEAAIIRQRGARSGGVAFTAATVPTELGGGLVVGDCPGTVNSAWFVGGGSVTRHASTLILTNLADVPAVIDLRFLGARGPIDAVNAEGIVIAPGTTRRLGLDQFAAGEQEIAVQVVRRRGSVSVDLLDATTGPIAGTELIPPTSLARQIELPGVIAGPGRTLIVANPGDAVLRADVQVLGAQGPFSPEGLAQVEVAAGAVVAVPIPDSAGADATALRISADRPVVAAVRMQPTPRDLAYATTATAVRGPVVVPVALGPLDLPPTLQVTAVDQAATVTIDVRAADGSTLGSTTLEVPANQVAQLDLATVVAAGSGATDAVIRSNRPVRGVSVHRSGEQVAVMPWREAPVVARGPSVRAGF